MALRHLKDNLVQFFAMPVPIVLVVFGLSNLVFTIEINYVKVPNAVKNNTNRPVILDCNYSIRPDDLELVVQWFLNEDLVYQWIPPNKPQSIGVLKNITDLTYKATDDPKTAYRALKIIRPTTNIAGEYKCLVSTLGDHDSRMKNMIVFDPEERLIISKSMDNEFVNFTCRADNVYPAPKLVLYKDVGPEIYSRMRISVVELDLKLNPNTQKYSIYIVGMDKVSRLVPGTLVHCELKIPGTGYIKLKSLLYYPGTATSDAFKIRKKTYFIVPFLLFIIIKK